MTLPELLLELASKNVQLSYIDDSLRYRALESVLNPSLREGLKAHKPDLIRILRDRPKAVLTTLPLSQNQLSLWFMYQMLPDSSSYNIGLAARIHGEVSPEAMRRSLDELIARHPLLRTSYGFLPVSEMIPCQHIHERMAGSFNEIACPEAGDSPLREKVQAAYSLPFDLINGPMIRMYLFTRSAREHVLLFCLHHISCDGWSFNTLLSDYETIYRKATLQTTAPPSPPANQYFDFIKFQSELIKTPFQQEAIEFWRRSIGGADQRLRMEFERLPSENDSARGDVETLAIDRVFYQRLKRFSKEKSITPFGLFLSAYHCLLYQHSREQRIITGVATAGSHRQTWSDVVGYFVNPISVWSKKNDESRYIDFCRDVQEHLVEGLRYQDYPFTSLVNDLSVKRNADQHPVFQAFFNLLSHTMVGKALAFLYPYDPSKILEWAGLEISPFGLNQQTANYHLSMEIGDTGESYFIILKYRADLFRKADIQKFLKGYLRLLEIVLQTPEIEIGRLLGNDAAPREFVPCLISGTYTIEPIIQPLEFWINDLDLKVSLECTEYNQLFNQLLDPASAFRKNTNGINLCLVRFDDWLSKEKTKENFQITLNQFTDAVLAATAAKRGLYVILLGQPAPSVKIDPFLSDLVRSAAEELARRFADLPSVYFISWEKTETLYPVPDFYQAQGEALANIPYTPAYYQALAAMSARVLYARRHLPLKAVIADCDGTLWDGVLGEDGIQGIRIDAYRQEIQRFLLDLRDQGVILCLCSKNDENDVLNVLDNHSGMLLKRKDIASHRINWSPKSKNIADLAKELRIGCDSLAFIDDSPIECGEVEANLPEAVVVQLPTSPEQALKSLRHFWAFDILKTTLEDRNRAAMYQEESRRNVLLSQTLTFSDFINQLDLRVSIKEARKEHIDRISQLSFRTNQFNFTSQRLSEADVARLLEDGGRRCFIAQVEDRFGDYGIVGVMIVRVEGPALELENFLLSCRALGRGVEHRMIAHLGSTARALSKDHLEISFVPSAKNDPARRFLDSAFSEYVKNGTEKTSFLIPTAAAEELTFRPEGNAQEADPARGILPSNPAGSIINKEKLLFIMSQMSSVASIEYQMSCFHADDKMNSRPSLVPQTETETKIASVWKDVLHVGFVYSNANFFECGGNSIQIPEIVMKLQKHFDIDIHIVDIFQYPTIRTLAEYVNCKNIKTPLGSQIQTLTQKRKTAIDLIRKRKISKGFDS